MRAPNISQCAFEASTRKLSYILCPSTQKTKQAAQHRYRLTTLTMLWRLLIYVGICRGRRTRIYFPFRATHSAHPPPLRHGPVSRCILCYRARFISTFSCRTPLRILAISTFCSRFPSTWSRRRRFFPSSSFTHTLTRTHTQSSRERVFRIAF